MKRTGLTYKECFGCQAPTQTVPESARVICHDCTMAGVRFPRDVQTEMFNREGAKDAKVEEAAA